MAQAGRIGEQGRYELIEEIESGGMGTVWRGYDTVLDREIAVKLIRPDVVTSPAQAQEFSRRFEREARVTARIGHHGVPQVFDAVLDEASYDRLYLVMEYVRGFSLRKVLTRAEEGAAEGLPVSWAASIAAQICTVLSYAHAIPVVHRDLKPDNVLIAADGTVKVLDFGIAKLLRTDVTRLTATGSLIGTSRYMSPEQIDDAQITPLSDLYALGCVLHELVAGQPVFSGDSEYQFLRQHMDVPPKPLRTLRPEVPEGLEALTLELLAKVPEQRPADAYEVYERLSPHLPQPGSAAVPVFFADGGDCPSAVPDPTVVYRQPNAPLRRTSAPAAPPEPVAPGPVPRGADTALRDAVRDAYARSADLAEGGRYAQAADVLKAVIATAATALGAHNPRVLALRRQRAAVLMAGEDYRRALPEFDALAAVYTRTAGPAGESALECRRHAAYCRANLGQATAAMREFQEVLKVVSGATGEGSETALDLRRSIGILLVSEGRRTEAEGVLDALHEDMCVLLGEDDEETREIAALLARLRGPDGSRPPLTSGPRSATGRQASSPSSSSSSL
ncbi:serine/threonine-protein kinase [Streptomyces sp. TRM 70351]|uniref:serine/threonine-protein kinase n=1 Tax=Streptomyces sp. TRM 70351 TaxID=3116552 RepID=UPI002E7B84C7|nr:serine/threonine-protein kinase [Streptomyces sp. TRM 70351]MEE1927589.1 serine/threonine-protein kinase [Streptomyces sp. TRM 70351]